MSTIQGRKYCEKKRNCLFSQCFPQLYILVHQNAVLGGNGLTHNPKFNSIVFFRQMVMDFENIVQKVKGTAHGRLLLLLMLDFQSNSKLNNRALVSSICSFSHNVFKRNSSSGSLKIV